MIPYRKPSFIDHVLGQGIVEKAATSGSFSKKFLRKGLFAFGFERTKLNTGMK